MPEKKRRKRTDSKASNPVSGAVLSAVIAGVIIVAAMLLICSGVIIKSDMSKSLMPVASLACAALASFSAGLVVAMKLRKNGLVMGLIIGVIMFVLLFTVSFAVNKAVGINALFLLAATLGGGALGGISGVNIKRKK